MMGAADAVTNNGRRSFGKPDRCRKSVGCEVVMTSSLHITWLRILILVCIFLIHSSRAAVDQTSDQMKQSAKSVAMQQTIPSQRARSSATTRMSQRNGGASVGHGMKSGGGIHYSGESANVSLLLDSILRGYDKRLRPNYNGNPVEVGVTMHVSSVSSISEVNMDFTLDFYFRQMWHDPRLNFTEHEDELCISNEMLARIWWPDTFFANAKMANFHTATTHNAFLRIKPNGWITLSLRLTVTSMCPMDLTYFPMDTQICSLEIESYAYSEKHIAYKWKEGPRNSIGLSKILQLPQFSIRGFRANNKLEQLSTGNYSRLACEFYFVRSIGYYLIHIYIPSCLIVVLSWVSFWLHRDASPARVGLGITTVLTMTTILSSSNASLPKISYLKSIDFYLVTCFFMVFASLLEYASVSYINNLSRAVSITPASGSTTSTTGRRNSKTLVLPPEVHVEAGQSRACARHDGGNGKKASKLTKEMVVTEVSIKPTAKLGTATFDCRVQSAHTTPPAGSFMLGPLPRGHDGLTATSASGKSRDRGNRRKRKCSSNGLGLDAANDRDSEEAKVDRLVALACRIDRYSRGVFPLAFTAFNITYWVIFVNISPQPHETDFVIVE